MNEVNTKTIDIKGKRIGAGLPLICTPLIGSTTSELLSELNLILPKGPDMIEWRADFFHQLQQTDVVLYTAQQLRERLIDIPFLFTIRSEKEGGQWINLSEVDKVQLIEKVCTSKIVDMIDYEVDSPRESIDRLRQAAQIAEVKLVLSHHNFKYTPEKSFIVNKLLTAEALGAHISKVAVMPENRADVLTLLQATAEAHELSQIPVVSISMGDDGVISRALAWAFGSAVTFAVGNESSAPGQIPITDLKSVISTMHHYINSSTDKIERGQG